MKIFFAGDSTMQFNDYSTYPQVGWPQVFPTFVKREIELVNVAKNGRSTKSFIDEMRLDFIENLIQKDDFLFIEFGHNDEKIQDPSRYTEANTTYKQNLLKMINVARNKGAYPLLLTPVARRKFIDGRCVETHEDYRKAMIELANDENVPLIDIDKMLMEYNTALGDEKSKMLYMNFEENVYPLHPESSNDDTHLRYDGGFVISKFVAEELKKIKGPYKEILCEPIKPNPVFKGGVM